MALTTLASVKAQAGIGISDTSRDTQIRSLIDGISSLIKQQLNRELESREYVEFYSGSGSSILLLRQFPVTNVTQVCIDDAGYFGASPDGFDNSRNLIEGIDYALMSGARNLGSAGMLRRIGTTWNLRPYRAAGILQNMPGVPNGNIKIRYTAGFTTIPPAIMMAVNSAVIKQLALSAIGGGASQLSYEDSNISFVNADEATALFGTVETALAQYRSIAI